MVKQKDRFIIGIGIFGCETLLYWENNYECDFYSFLIFDNRTEELIQKKLNTSNSDIISKKAIFNASNEMNFDKLPHYRFLFNQVKSSTDVIVLLNFSESFSNTFIINIFKKIQSYFKNIHVFAVLPFTFEGEFKKDKAMAQVEELKKIGIKFEVLDDQKTKSKYTKKTTLNEAYKNSYEHIAKKLDLKKVLKTGDEKPSKLKLWIYDVSKIAVGTFVGGGVLFLCMFICLYLLLYFGGPSVGLD